MDDFDPTCPRCKGNGLSPDQAAVLAAQKAVALPKPPLSPRDVGQDVINSLTGALVFLLPGLIVALFGSGSSSELGEFSSIVAVNEQGKNNEMHEV